MRSTFTAVVVLALVGLLAGCSTPAGSASSSAVVVDSSGAPTARPSAVRTCPPDTAPYDPATHTAPPADGPVDDCVVPEMPSTSGPPKQAVPLETPTP